MKTQPSSPPIIHSSIVAFEFATAARIVFGAGRMAEAGALARSLGRRALVVMGHSAGAIRRAEPLFKQLDEFTTFEVTGEPTIDDARRGAEQARAATTDLVIGFGGGSVLDAGKAIAALLANGGDPLDYVEVIGRGRPLARPAAPVLAIPTTAGTGAEVTRNAVLGSPEHRVKVSLRSAHLLPRVALVDPELTYGLPPELTAATGLDALTQLIEPFVSVKANPMTDAICREGMRRAARSLRRAFEHGDDRAAREDLSLAGLFGGLALANAGLGAVHGFAAPVGGMFAAPHGAVCAALLPAVMEMNVRVLRQGRPGASPVPDTTGIVSRPSRDGRATLARFDEIGRLMTGRDDAVAEDGVAWVRELCGAVKIPALRAYGVSGADFPALIEKAAAASSMKGNPVALTSAEMQEVIERAL